MRTFHGEPLLATTLSSPASFDFGVKSKLNEGLSGGKISEYDIKLWNTGFFPRTLDYVCDSLYFLSDVKGHD